MDAYGIVTSSDMAGRYERQPMGYRIDQGGGTTYRKSTVSKERRASARDIPRHIRYPEVFLTRIRLIKYTLTYRKDLLVDRKGVGTTS